MKFEFIYEPVPIIIIRDIFTKKENNEILSEAINNKNKFKHAVISIGEKPDFRSNKAAYYDEIYINDRSRSKLHDKIDTLFKDVSFQETLSSAPYPIHLFDKSNHHETQVSRYGDEGQFYKYHIDSSSNDERQVSMVYYFYKEPKKYKGGDIQFTNSPIQNGKPIDKNADIITLTPENNMAIIFGARTPHTVLPTTSPKTFNKGRFSMNCWIGKI